jgi:hypothetical protein
MFPLVHKISEMCRPWGIRIAAETETELRQTCKNNDTDFEGYSNRANTRTEDDGHPLFENKAAKDPNNGHKKA